MTISTTKRPPRVLAPAVIRARVLDALARAGRDVTSSQLQGMYMAGGSNLKAAVVAPVLEGLVAEGVVLRTTGRDERFPHRILTLYRVQGDQQ